MGQDLHFGCESEKARLNNKDRDCEDLLSYIVMCHIFLQLK